MGDHCLVGSPSSRYVFNSCLRTYSLGCSTKTSLKRLWLAKMALEGTNLQSQLFQPSDLPA
jgi:hypothetical protein